MGLRCSASFAALLVLLAARTSAGVEGVDLTAHLAPRPLVGDYRVYAIRVGDTEYERRVDVVSVDGGDRGWRVVWSGDPGETAAEVVRAGAKSRTSGDAPQLGCQYAIEPGARRCRLRLRPEKPRSFGRTYFDLSDLDHSFRVRRTGRYHFAGIEAIETPFASHAAAVRLVSSIRDRRARLSFLPGGRKIASLGPWRLFWVETTESWFVEGVGLVGLVRTVVDGEGQPATSRSEEVWLEEGLVQGVPYP